MAKHKQQNEKNNGKMKRKLYEKELHKLQVQLCHLQEWVKAKGLKIIIVFDVRARQGGTIKALTERLVLAFSGGGASGAFDRERHRCSYSVMSSISPLAANRDLRPQLVNRAGVERVMGYVDEQQSDRFLSLCPVVEKQIVDSGIMLIKIWLKPASRSRRSGLPLALRIRFGSGS
jgi:polyphosphate kinase 2 (PPK2 family)